MADANLKNPKKADKDSDSDCDCGLDLKKKKNWWKIYVVVSLVAVLSLGAVWFVTSGNNLKISQSQTTVPSDKSL